MTNPVTFWCTISCNEFAIKRCNHCSDKLISAAFATLAPLNFKTRKNTMAQYVYTMNRVGKIVPPKREILKDISLSFFPGAKIGVLGFDRY